MNNMNKNKNGGDGEVFGQEGRVNNENDENIVIDDRNQQHPLAKRPRTNSNNNNNNIKNNHTKSVATTSASTKTTYYMNNSSSSSSLYRTKVLLYGPHITRRTNDEIHSSIFFDPVLSTLIDTPIFQRLRDIQQLGTSQYVYMNANHTRFEHSIGVCHLAEKLITTIIKKQPQLRSSPKDVLCIKIAGLFHDLGHGPFSHIYEEFVKGCMNTTTTNGGDETAKQQKKKKWKHEECTLQMIDKCLEYLGLAIDTNNLDLPLKQIGNGIDAKSIRVFVTTNTTTTTTNKWEDDDNDTSMILTSRDWIFIKECILGGQPIQSNDNIIGRPNREDEWLYDIVANQHSGLDVDKIDYFARDGRRCLSESGEIEKLFIEEAFVAWGKCTNNTNMTTASCKNKCRCSYNNNNTNNQNRHHHYGQHLMICYPKKLVNQAMRFFTRRYYLHKEIYQHKTVVAAGFLICDILCKAGNQFLIPIIDNATNTNTNSYHNKYNQDEKLPAIAATAAAAAATLNRDNSISTMHNNNNNGIQWIPLIHAISNPDAFVRLRDSIIDHIAFTSSNELQEARELVQRLYNRDFYKVAAQQSLDVIKNKNVRNRIKNSTEDQIINEMLNFRGYHNIIDKSNNNNNTNHNNIFGSSRYNNNNNNHQDRLLSLTKDDIRIKIIDIHHGQKGNNPLSNMRFLSKEKMSELTKDIYELPEAMEGTHPDLISCVQLPASFIEYSIFVYSRDSSKTDLVKHVFELWWLEINAEMEQTIMENNLNNNNNNNHNNNGDDYAHMLTQESVVYDDGYESDNSFEKNYCIKN